jgi:hypothetical protein
MMEGATGSSLLGEAPALARRPGMMMGGSPRAALPDEPPEAEVEVAEEGGAPEEGDSRKLCTAGLLPVVASLSPRRPSAEPGTRQPRPEDDDTTGTSAVASMQRRLMLESEEAALEAGSEAVEWSSKRCRDG